MEINYALIGKRIRETRKQRGLSAEELAEIADLSTVYISYIENAKRKPSLESLIKISNALEITIDELLYGNLLYNPTEYQTDIDLLMADCTSTEKRYIFEVLSAIKNILRINDWHLSSRHNYDADNLSLRYVSNCLHTKGSSTPVSLNLFLISGGNSFDTSAPSSTII